MSVSLRNKWAYVPLDAIRNELFPFWIGPSTRNLLEIAPIPPLNETFWLLPSFWYTSKTDDNLPPYEDGIPPLNNLTSFIASELKTENKPNIY